MVNLKLTKMQVHELLVWGTSYNEILKGVGMKFEEDEIALYAKLFLASRSETVSKSKEELIVRFPAWAETLNSLPILKKVDKHVKTKRTPTKNLS